MNEPQENLTALDMLTLQNAKLTSERDQAIRELARISQENAEALQRVEAENERLKAEIKRLSVYEPKMPKDIRGVSVKP